MTSPGAGEQSLVRGFPVGEAASEVSDDPSWCCNPALPLTGRRQRSSVLGRCAGSHPVPVRGSGSCGELSQTGSGAGRGPLLPQRCAPEPTETPLPPPPLFLNDSSRAAKPPESSLIQCKEVLRIFSSQMKRVTLLFQKNISTKNKCAPSIIR